MINYTTQEVMGTGLTPEGQQIAELGSHEARVWAALPAKGSGPPLSIPELKKLVGDESAKIGQGRAFKSGWIGKEGEGLVKLVRDVFEYISKTLVDVTIFRLRLLLTPHKMSSGRFNQLGRWALVTRLSVSSRSANSSHSGK